MLNSSSLSTTELPGSERVARTVKPPQHSAWVRNRELLLELLRRDLRSRHRGSGLGAAWSLLNPLLYMMVYTVVFSNFLRFRIPGAPYPVYLLSGLLAWNFFAQAVTYSAGSVLGNGSLVKKVAFPWILLTISAVLAAFVNYSISLLLLLPLVIYFHVVLGPALLAVPLVALVTLALAMGISLLVAAGNVYFRDVEYLLNIVLQVGFFLTPIIYSFDTVAGANVTHKGLGRYLPWLLYLNPMTWVATSFQDIIAFNRWPSHAAGLLYTTVAAVALLALGLLVFSRLQVRFAEEL